MEGLAVKEKNRAKVSGVMPEALDIEDPVALSTYLHASGRIGPSERPTIKVLGGGVSNRTVWVRRESGETWVMKQALAKLRVAVDWFSDPRRIEREALGMRLLAAMAPPGAITPLVFEDPAHHLLAMRAVPEPHENWKEALLAGRVDLDYVRQFGALLGLIQRAACLRIESLDPVLDDRSFFESLRMEAYYLYSAGQIPQAGAFLHDLVQSTRATRRTLVHGDYSPKNVLIHNQRIVLLDHEVLHTGDGAFDVGFAMAHFLSKAHHLPARRTEFVASAKEFWNAHVAALAVVPWPDHQERAVRHALGCLLARVAGRSCLEYLAPGERARQREAVVALMAQPVPPATISGLADEFVARL